jgi:hypothetical protein
MGKSTKDVKITVKPLTTEQASDYFDFFETGHLRTIRHIGVIVWCIK